MNETIQAFDRWLILALGIWFIPKGLLFHFSVYYSRKLTPPHLRTDLGNAYRGLFTALGIFSYLMAALFLVRASNPRPSNVDTADWIALGLRVLLIVLMAWVNRWEIGIAMALIRRVRLRQFSDLDHPPGETREQPHGIQP